MGLRHRQAEVKTPGACFILPFLLHPTSCPLANAISHDFKIIQILAVSPSPCYGPSPGGHGPQCSAQGPPSWSPWDCPTLPYLQFHAAVKKPFYKPTVNTLLFSKPSQDFPSHLKSNSESFKGTAPTSLSFLAPNLFSPPTPSIPATLASCLGTFAAALLSAWNTLPPVFLTAAFCPASRTWPQCHLPVEPLPDPAVQIQTPANPIPVPHFLCLHKKDHPQTPCLLCSPFPPRGQGVILVLPALLLFPQLLNRVSAHGKC